MKTALIALAALAAALTLPVSANAQDWVMDWHSTGTTLFSTWDLSGTSTATLTPTTLGPGYHPDGPGYLFNYTYQGRQYGGLVAQGRFQDSGFSVPAAGGAPISNNSFGPGTNANGEFNITGSSFTADVFVGTGHANAHWTATGRLASVAAAPSSRCARSPWTVRTRETRDRPARDTGRSEPASRSREALRSERATAIGR